MKLYRQTISAWSWLFSVIRAFLSKRSATTVAVICASVLSRIAKLLAFFLPLKVILLAGSSGVPRYLPFVDPAHKMEWIAGLTAGAFASYALMLAMDALVRRWSEDAGAEIHQEANELVVFMNQQAEAESYYMRFCQVCAGMVFVALGMLVLCVVDLRLALFLTVLVAAQFVFSAFVMSGPDDVNPGAFRRFIEENLGGYLSVLSSLNFLSGFLVILAPFLGTGGEGNILMAILSIVIVRQVLANLSAVVKGTVELSEDRHKINALVFREYQLEKVEHRLQKTLRELFHRSARYVRIREELERCGRPSAGLTVAWVDPFVRGVSLFDISTGGEDRGGTAHYQLQVFPPSQLHQMENEDFLFRSLSRPRLKAPALVTSFAEGPFECRIYEHGTGAGVSAGAWWECYRGLLEHYWSCLPPRGLVSAFSASHPPFHKRLSDEMAGRLNVAVDTEAEEALHAAFQSQLPSIRDWISTLPLYVHNPDINRYGVVHTGDGDVRVMHWGRWTLEPVGAFLPRGIDESALAAMLGKARRERGDIPDGLTPGQLILVSQCRQLEDEIGRERHKSALQLLPAILDGFATHVERPSHGDPGPRDAIARP